MKTIINPKSIVIKMLGKQKIQDKQYRLLRFVLETKCEDGWLLYNLVTGELILVNEEERELIRNIQEPLHQILNIFVEKYFIVPCDYNEYEMIESLRKIKRAFSKNSVHTYSILPTTACNARCFYCFEEGIKPLYMSEETAHELVEFMKIHHNGITDLRIEWFGGEPLLGANRITQICKELQTHNIGYTATMVTNGYLFSTDYVELGKNLWNLEHVQITLDGPKDIYNSTKAYIGIDENPYATVLSNIESLLRNEIAVIVRINIGDYNKAYILELIDELKERFGKYKLFSCYVHYIYAKEEDALKGKGAVSKDLKEYVSNIEEVLQEKQLLTDFNYLPSLKFNSCIMDSEEMLLVDPLGRLGKCGATYQNHFIGDLKNGITNFNEVESLKRRVDWPECKNCILYPVCIKLANCIANIGSECYTTDINRKVESVKYKMLYNYKRYNNTL